MTLVAENLYTGYHVGFDCVDSSVAPTESFKCHVCLLCVVADYPALALVTGFTHAGGRPCHWCKVEYKKNMATHRYTSGFRQFLPPLHEGRRAGGNFDTQELRSPPAYRTHKETVISGLLNRDWQGYKNARPVLTTGVCNWSPLCVVPLFDIVWDAMGDMMHDCLAYPHHILPVMKGTTALAPPRPLKLVDDDPDGITDEEQQAENKEKTRINLERQERHQLEQMAVKGAAISGEMQTTVDARFSRLHGLMKCFGRQDKTVFQKKSSMITSDWTHFLQYADVYAFHGVLEEPYNSAYFSFTGVYRTLLDFTCNTDQTLVEATRSIERLETSIVESLTAFERVWPSCLFSGPVIHSLLHFPRHILRYNSPRNYWCYFNER